jgi:tripartite-type tricarboxylate transporter receptor subunit TctC
LKIKKDKEGGSKMQNWKKIRILTLILAMIFLGITDQKAASQTRGDVETFYKGKTIKFIVPYSPGGALDPWIRTIAPHLEKHTGAKVIVENTPGAGGLVGATQLYFFAKPDGLTIGALLLTGLIIADMLELETARFEVEKFTYIGRIDVVWRILLASRASGFKSIEDMQKAIKPIRFGVVEKTSPSAVDAAIMSEAFSLKSKIIPGYKGTMEYLLAIVAGRELDAISAFIPGYEEYVQKGDLTMVAVQGNKRFPNYPQVPTIFETRSIKPEGKKLLELLNVLAEAGRFVVLAPPGVPEERRLFLDKALIDSLKEPALLDWAKKNDVIASPLPGNQCKALVDRLSEIVPKAERPKLKHILTEKYY